MAEIRFRDRYFSNRVLFAKELLGLEKLEKWQEAELHALDTGTRWISVQSGHGVGKSCFLSICILHFLLTRGPSTDNPEQDAKIACTAPSAHQLHTGLQAEISKWFEVLVARVPQLKDALTFKHDVIELTGAPRQCFCAFKTSRVEAPEALQGVHAMHTMLVADEASGVAEKVFEAAAGSMSTPGAITLLCGNPTRNTGYFYRTHHDIKGKPWRATTVSCLDSSRVDPSYVDSELILAGGDVSNNRYRIRVLGLPPLADEDTLISRTLVEQAVARDVHAPRNHSVVWGLDIARSGADASALAKRKGSVITSIQRFKLPDLMQLVGRISKEYHDTNDAEKPEHIFCDVIGIGAGVFDRARELGLPVVAVNVSTTDASFMGMAPTGMRLRDELWIRARDWFATRAVKFPNDAETIEELIAPTYTFSSTGAVRLESKDEMKARGVLGGKSPDGADAVVMTFAYEVAGVTAASLKGDGDAWSGSKSKGPIRRAFSQGRV